MKKIFKKFVENQLKFLVSHLLKNNKPLIIGITGSAGKTTTKELVYEVLNKSKKFHNKVSKSEGNLNTEVGLPISVLGFKNQPDNLQWPFLLLIAYFRVFISQLNPIKNKKILVLEFAADKPGDIEYLTSFIKPTISIITIIGPAHLVNYNSIEDIAKEKSKLIESLPSDGLAILNKNDYFSNKIVKQTKANVKFFDSKTIDESKEIALIVADYFEISKKEVENTISNFKPLKHRLNLLRSGKINIIDDSYNANPVSMQLAINTLSKYAREIRAKRKIAVLGDMLELGKDSKLYHQEIGELAGNKVDILIGVGELSKYYKPKINFTNLHDAEIYLKNEIVDGDIILFKGSRRIGLDKLVNKILVK